jgi:hypothetical protein
MGGELFDFTVYSSIGWRFHHPGKKYRTSHSHA